MRHPDYESKEAFKLRFNEFKSIITPKWIEISTGFYEKLYDIFENNPSITYEEYKNQFDFFGDKTFFSQKKNAWKRGTLVLNELEKRIY